MWHFLSGITITCFAMSYAIALVLECSRLFFRVPARHALTAGITLIGVLTHTVFLVARASNEVSGRTPLANWYDWCLMVAWVLAAVYLAYSVRRPTASMGLFLLPPVLMLIAVSTWGLEPDQPASANAKNLWTTVHGGALLLGTVSVLVGFSGGLMYLIQSYRLKHKLPPRPGFNLPSLEWLGRINERSLIVSSILLSVGLLSGMILNAYRSSREVISVPWRDPIVWTSGLLIAWVASVALFNAFYKPARVGRKVAYLSLANFCFLGLVLYILMSGYSQHSNQRPPAENRLEHQDIEEVDS